MNTRLSSPFSHTLRLKAPQSASKQLLSHKTERKSSLNDRTVLGPMNTNSSEYNTGVKGHNTLMPKQASIEMSKNQQIGQSHASRWLDSEK
jgi:hypothetical protein